MLGTGIERTRRLSPSSQHPAKYCIDVFDFRSLLEDLKNIGATNADVGRHRGLMTPRQLRALEQRYREVGFENGKYVATYEVVYGHAWTK